MDDDFKFFVFQDRGRNGVHVLYGFYDNFAWPHLPQNGCRISPKRISTSLIVSLMVLLFVSTTKITVFTCYVTHSVIKLSGIN